MAVFTDGVVVSPLLFFPVQFQIKHGVLSNLYKVKEPKSFPCYLPSLACISAFPPSFLSCNPIISHLIYIKPYLFSPQRCTPSFPETIGVGSKTDAQETASPDHKSLPRSSLELSYKSPQVFGQESIWEKESQVHLKTLYFPWPNLV